MLGASLPRVSLSYQQGPGNDFRGQRIASAKELAYVHRAMAAATRDAIGPMAARHEEAVHLEMALESLETQLDRLTEAARRQEAAARGVYEDLVGTLAQIANASRELCVNVERFSTLKDVRRYLQQFKPPVLVATAGNDRRSPEGAAHGVQRGRARTRCDAPSARPRSSVCLCGCEFP